MLSSLTPMLEQYHLIKRDHRDAILMFRMGDFYEMFFEDALTASKVLEIALTARGRGTDNEAPMCGVPHHAVDAYIARLISSGHKVAVCDQVEDARQARGLVRREVIRVVSAGTHADPAQMESREPLYIACLCSSAGGLGTAFLDLSTGDFRIAEARGADPWDEVALQMATFRPRELLHPETLDLAALGSALGGDIQRTVLPDWQFGHDAAGRALTDQMGTRSLAGFGCHQMRDGIRAAGALLQHLRATQRSTLGHIDRVTPWVASDHMILDAPTLSTLELTRRLAGPGRDGTLLSVLDQTVTPMGARRLQTWILAPLLRSAPIARRLEAVAELVAAGTARHDLRLLLAPIRDIERLLSRVTLGAANARDLLALRQSFEPLPRIAAMARSFSAELLAGDAGAPAVDAARRPAPVPGPLDALEDLHTLLGSAVADDPPPLLREGGMIRSGYNEELDKLRCIARDGTSYLAALEASERARTGIGTLKVRFNRVFGYYIEVSKTNLHLVPPDYERRQTLVGAERFVTPELKRYEEKVLTAQDRIAELEYDLFIELRDRLAAQAARIRGAADRLADLDVLACLAEVAVARGYVRPQISEDPCTIISEGRHPVVETTSADERFVPNDLECGAGRRILIITGPNMGGKSTYLRQSALITLMAQMGSFVPAASARIGLTDRIFSRIGSSDNLAGGQSTFMVEMQETANILHNATARSLILLDEVGRGTSTFDGLSLAWAVVEHLHDAPGLRGPDRQGARVLFATHYHELTELALSFPDIMNLTVCVQESGNDVVFLRRIEAGAADRSYGIHVARLAGLPRGVLDRAEEILGNLERNEIGRDGLPVLARHTRDASGAERSGSQLALFGQEEEGAASEILSAIRGCSPESMTPLEALALVHRLKQRAGPK